MRYLALLLLNLLAEAKKILAGGALILILAALIMLLDMLHPAGAFWYCYR